MESWKKLLLRPKATIFETLKHITEGSAQIALVIDNDNKLLGTVTDGDIRAAILAGYSLEDSVEKIMNTNPIKHFKDNHNKDKLIDIMLKNQIHQLPLVDLKGKVVGLQTIDELLRPKMRENLVVIMCGGAGKRLLPLTNDLPKPMLMVGGKPLLEVNLNRLKAQGFKRFCLTVGFKAEIIKNYFKDGRQWDISIEYIHEDKPLGTAGALHLLEEQNKSNIVVMNGDLLTGVRFDQLIDFHEENQVDCTICIREFDYQLPYGVVEIKNQKVLSISEKPIYKYFVNAGVYVMNPELLSYIPKNEYYLMTTFLDKLMEMKRNLVAFPLMEYWSDIGQLSDYEKACRDFEEIMS